MPLRAGAASNHWINLPVGMVKIGGGEGEGGGGGGRGGGVGGGGVARRGGKHYLTCFLFSIINISKSSVTETHFK